jgi:hypothetical protein
MKTSALAIAGLLVPTLATAQPAPAGQPAPALQGAATQPPPSTSQAATPPTAAPDDEPQARIGAEIALLPVGSLKASAGDFMISGDTALALGVGGVVQHPIDQHFTVELAPRLVFHVKGQNDDKSATELDLRGRVTAGGYVSPSIRLYGAFEPGYSFLFLPDDGGDVSSPNGLTLGLAGGAAFKTGTNMMLTAELGYQFGYQQTRILGTGVDLHANFLHFAVGMLFDL